MDTMEVGGGTLEVRRERRKVEGRKGKVEEI